MSLLTPEQQILEHLRALGVKRVVLYGYRSRSHTHHWIMAGFQRAFQRIFDGLPEYDLRWEDNRSKALPELLRGALVLGNLNVDHVDWCLPLRRDSVYVMHNHNPARLDTRRYEELKAAGRCTFYEVFRGDPQEDFHAIDDEPCHFESLRQRRQVLTWGTDLLPQEVRTNIARLPQLPRSPGREKVIFVGSVWRANAHELAALARACVSLGLDFVQHGRHLQQAAWPESQHIQLNPDTLPFTESVSAIQSATLAPAIQGLHQLQNPPKRGNYVPCRIFKNISYGTWGLSNNPTTTRLFGAAVVTDSDFQTLLERGLEQARRFPDRQPLAEVMQHVAQRHTYLNRIATMLRFARLAREQGGTEDNTAGFDRGRWLARKAVYSTLGRGWQ